MAKNTAAKPTKKEKKLLYTIAAKHIYDVENRGDLEAHRSDEEDFIETSVWELEAALEAAYRAGLEAGKKEGKQHVERRYDWSSGGERKIHCGSLLGEGL